MAAAAAGTGQGGLQFRVCSKCGDSIHPFGFSRHVRGCTGEVRRKSSFRAAAGEICPHCQCSISKYAYHKHVERCGRKRANAASAAASSSSRAPPPPAPSASAAAPPAAGASSSGVGNPRKRRLQGKQPRPAAFSAEAPPPVPWPAPTPAHRNRRLAQAQAKPRVRKVVSSSGKSWKCKYCHQMISAQNHVYDCKQAPWSIWSAGCKHRATRRDKQFTHAQISAWTFHCPHCDLRFPHRCHFSKHFNQCQARRVASGLPV